MAFNSYTYHANKYRRWRVAAMKKARDAKRFGQTENVASYVKLARSYHQCSMSNRRLREMQRQGR